jgi:hypothetical protein
MTERAEQTTADHAPITSHERMLRKKQRLIIIELTGAHVEYCAFPAYVKKKNNTEL